MPVLQPTPRKSFTKSAALGRRLNAQRTTSQSVLVATIELENEEREFIRRERPYGVQYFVRSTVCARYYIVSERDGKYETSTFDETTSKRIIARLQAWLKSQAEAVAAQAEYLNEQKLAQLRAGNFYDLEGPHKKTTDKRPARCPHCRMAELERGCEMCANCWLDFYRWR